MLRRLKEAYLQWHHARLRRRSNYPARQARRMLQSVFPPRHSCGILCDLGAGYELSLVAEFWRGRRIAVDVMPGPGLDIVGKHRKHLGAKITSQRLSMHLEVRRISFRY